MNCDFDCLDVKIFANVNTYYTEQKVKTTLGETNIPGLLPNDIVINLRDIIGKSNAKNIIDLYAPLLAYLNERYHLYWSSVIIWNPIIKDYLFRAIKTDNISTATFNQQVQHLS